MFRNAIGIGSLLNAIPLVLFMSASARAAPPSSVVSSLKQNKSGLMESAVLNNKIFTMVDHPYSTKDGPVLLVEQTESSYSSDASLIRRGVKVDAWSGKGFSKKTWAINDSDSVASSGVKGPFYEIVTQAEGAMVNVKSWYSLASGKVIYTGTSDIVKMTARGVRDEKPEAKERYVAIHESMGWYPKSTAELQQDPKAIAVLQYGTQDQVRARVIIREASDDSDTVWRNVEIRIRDDQRNESGEIHTEKDVNLPRDGKSGSPFSDFSVILTWKDYPEVIIPFKNDVPRLSEATVPAGLSIEAARSH